VGAVFLVLAFILLALPGAYREGIASGIRSTVLLPVFALQEGSVERHARFDDPERLRAQRDSLASYLVGQSALELQNTELRQLLGLTRRLPPSFVPAEVIWLTGRGAEGYFQLTAGADQGVRVGAPIVAPGGLVGRVRNLDGRIAFGIGWMSQEFRASAMTVDGSVYGIVEPRQRPGGASTLALTNTPRHVKLPDGTLIVTSGHGGIFPAGIPIGRISGMEGQETSWQRTYLIEPAVSPAEMTYVLVLGPPQQEARLDLASVWGIRAASGPGRDTTAATAAAMFAGEAPAEGISATTEPAPQESAPAPEPRQARPAPSGPPLLGTPVQPASPDTNRRR
jgi:rod shape-determining protein MreC